MPVPEDERAVRKLLERHGVQAALPVLGKPLRVELGIDRIGPACAGVTVAPDGAEALVVLPAAQRAGPMPCGERRRLVEEEQLGEAAGLQQRSPQPAAELEPAGDPAPAVVPPADLAVLVVQAAAVSVDEPPCRIGDQLAERSDPVSQRHRGLNLSGRTDLGGRESDEVPVVPSTFGEDAFGRRAEAAARFFGTPKYIAGQTVAVIIWIAVNAAAVSLRWDPYPFILLNLAFSTQAAYAAPLILLAQTRQADRDKMALDQLEAHREEVMEHMEEKEAALKAETDELKRLLEANTDLTRQDKDLTERIAALTREIHARLPAP